MAPQPSSSPAQVWLVLRDPLLSRHFFTLVADEGTVLAPQGLAGALSAREGPALVVDAASASADRERFLSWIAQPARAQPLLFLAGPEDSALAAAVISAGAEFYLRLPVSDGELKATFFQLLRLA